MTAFVVDTNVVIVANGRRTDADLQCQLACIDRLNDLVAGQSVAIDDQGCIVKEYADHANWEGGPGVGDKFFKYVVDNQYMDNRVHRVSITPSKNEDRGFDELPPNSFDRSDRKFLAVAVVEKAIVLNATDSDWRIHADLMARLAVEVQQLCPEYRASGES